MATIRLANPNPVLFPAATPKHRGALMARRTVGALLPTVYERTPTKGGKRDWAHQPKRTPNTIVRIVPLHQYGQGQSE